VVLPELLEAIIVTAVPVTAMENEADRVTVPGRLASSTCKAGAAAQVGPLLSPLFANSAFSFPVTSAAGRLVKAIWW